LQLTNDRCGEPSLLLEQLDEILENYLSRCVAGAHVANDLAERFGGLADFGQASLRVVIEEFPHPLTTHANVLNPVCRSLAHVARRLGGCHSPSLAAHVLSAAIKRPHPLDVGSSTVNTGKVCEPRLAVTVPCMR